MRDARQIRTRRALAEAILRLAGQRGVDQLAVNQIAAEAGVGRATFYRHASSPEHLLAAVLTDELDALRARAEHTAAERRSLVFREVLIELACHLESFQPIYREASSPVSSALTMLLTEHIEVSVLHLLDDHDIEDPDWHANDSFARKATAAQFAHGIVGILEAWIREPDPRDPELVLLAVDTLAPPWWRELGVRLSTDTPKPSEADGDLVRRK
ncbi:MAG: TetR/AcrR family transcriptional regulator [Propioniciclava sp.]